MQSFLDRVGGFSFSRADDAHPISRIWPDPVERVIGSTDQPCLVIILGEQDRHSLRVDRPARKAWRTQGKIHPITMGLSG
jgi:hypothetical protein